MLWITGDEKDAHTAKSMQKERRCTHGLQQDVFYFSNRNQLKLGMISLKGTRYLNSETWQEVLLGYKRD